MKQGLFANCYSTIHGLNLLKHIYTHTHMHTHIGQEFLRFEESLSLALIGYFMNSTWESHKHRTVLSLLLKINSTSSARYGDLFVTRLSSWVDHWSVVFLVEGTPRRLVGCWCCPCLKSLGKSSCEWLVSQWRESDLFTWSSSLSFEWLQALTVSSVRVWRSNWVL